MTVADLSAARRPLALASHVPRALYASPEFYRLDGARLFMRDWLYVGRIENLMDFYHVGVLHAKTFGANFAWTDDNVHLKPGGGLSIFIPFWLPGGGENHPDALVTQQSLWIDGARIAVDGVIVDPPPLPALAARLVPTVALPGASPSNV